MFDTWLKQLVDIAKNVKPVYIFETSEQLEGDREITVSQLDDLEQLRETLPLSDEMLEQFGTVKNWLLKMLKSIDEVKRTSHIKG